MFSLELEVKGLEGLIQAFSSENLDATLTKAMGIVGAAMEEDAGEYPPQPPPRNPKRPYKRTGRLGTSLTSEVQQPEEGAYVAVLGSNVTYAPRVWAKPDDEPIGQAWMHIGIWTPLQTSIEAHLGEYSEIIEQSVYSALSG